MKLYTKMLVIFAAICCSQPVVARDALLEAEIKDIKVTSIAPAIQQQLKQAGPDERKSLEAAIHTGNLFIPQLFSGNAYDSDPENKDWEKEVKPLIAPSREDWDDQSLTLTHSKEIPLGKEVDYLMYTARLTCPQSSLISIQQDGDTTTLLYRTKSVGAMVAYRANLYKFSMEGAGDIYDVRINLDQDSALVNEVSPQDTWITWSYTEPIARMNRFLRDHRTANTVNKEHEIEMVDNYQIAIREIEKSAAKICR